MNPPTRTNRPQPYPFLDIIYGYMGDDPTIKPVHLVSSLTPSQDETGREESQQSPMTTPHERRENRNASATCTYEKGGFNPPRRM